MKRKKNNHAASTTTTCGVCFLVALLTLVAGVGEPLHGDELTDIVSETAEKASWKKVIEELLKMGRYAEALKKAVEGIMPEKIEAPKKIGQENYEAVLDCARRYCENALKGVDIKSTLTRFKGSKDEEKLTHLPTKDEVTKVLKCFDAQKDAIQQLIDQLRASLLRYPEQWKDRLLTEAEDYKKEIQNKRINYVSYNVMSPHLYEAHRLGYIARGFWNDDEEGIYKACRVLARGMHKNMLYEASEDVQAQYSEVVSYLKANLSDAEWEHVLSQTTLVPSLDLGKPRGTAAWWE